MTKHGQKSIERLTQAGIGYRDALALRRISMTLHRWHELECGTGEGQRQVSVERNEKGKPFIRVQFPTATEYVDRRWPTPDRETGALKRLTKIMERYPHFDGYVQTDPRGCALYIVRPGDVPDGESVDAYYNHGIAVCK